MPSLMFTNHYLFRYIFGVHKFRSLPSSSSAPQDPHNCSLVCLCKESLDPASRRYSLKCEYDYQAWCATHRLFRQDFTLRFPPSCKNYLFTDNGMTFKQDDWQQLIKEYNLFESSNSVSQTGIFTRCELHFYFLFSIL